MTQPSFLALPFGILGFRLVWCPIALVLAGLALAVAWAIRPLGLDFGAESFLSSAITAVGLMIALSALPVPSRSPNA